MKKIIILTTLSVVALATGIITYMNVSKSESEATKAQQSRVESVALPEAKSEEIPTASEAPQEPQVIVTEAEPITSPEVPAGAKYLGRDEVSGLSVQYVSELWNPKESGLMISTAHINGIILRTYDASPESFTESAIKSIVTSCIDRIKTMNQQEALQFVLSDTCL